MSSALSPTLDAAKRTILSRSATSNWLRSKKFCVYYIASSPAPATITPMQARVLAFVLAGGKGYAAFTAD